MSRLNQTKKAFFEKLSGNRVVFHHVPKCGGTSIERALRLRYPFAYATFPLPSIYSAIEAIHPNYGSAEMDDASAAFREIQLLSLLYQDVLCVAGHVYFSQTAHKLFAERYKFITTVREPVSFFRSFFVQMRTAREERWKVDCSFDDFLSSDLATLIGRFYLLYFSAWSRSSADDINSWVEIAMENLSKFHVVGLVEDMPRFQVRVQEALGVNLRIGHSNRSKSKPIFDDLEITPARRDRILSLSDANVKIYEFVKRELAC